jgi:hypothetical protein
MPINWDLVDAAVGSGEAFILLNRLGVTTVFDQADIDAIVRRFGGPSLINRDTATEIAVEFVKFVAAGERLANATTNRPQGASGLPALAGCDGPFEYQMVFQITDTFTGRSFNYTVMVPTDKPLGRFDVERLGRIGRDAAILKFETTDPRVGSVSRYASTDPGRITGAGRCV